MTDLASVMGLEDARSFVATATRTLGLDRVARELHISSRDLTLFQSGHAAVARQQDVLTARIAGWVQVRSEDLFRSTGHPVPPFDHLADFWLNFYRGPRQEADPAEVPARAASPVRFIDFQLNFPFGVPACPLTAHSGYVEFYARRSFDLVTYKTVRDRSWNAHPYPHWAFAVEPGVSPTPQDRLPPVVATLDPGASQTSPVSLVNSVGVPSLSPADWQADIQETKRRLQHGQVLVVSVMGSPEEALDDADLARQFAHAASRAAEAGSDIVEANLSCPNTGGEPICNSPAVAELIVRAVARELRPSRTPCFIKIGYLPRPALEELVQRCGPFIQGIVGINTASVRVTSPDGGNFFGSRTSAGLSGSAIRPLGLEVARNLVDLRTAYFRESDWVIVALGGVIRPAHFDAYMTLGVDAVQSCSGAWLNPNLALEIQDRDRPDSTDQVEESSPQFEVPYPNVESGNARPA